MALTTTFSLSCITCSSNLPIAIYYEQPNWFKPLFAELDRRGTPYVKLFAPEHFYAPEDHPEEKYSLVFNRMSPSARNHARPRRPDFLHPPASSKAPGVARGVKGVSGIKAFSSELSKAGQFVLYGFARHRLPQGPRHPPCIAKPGKPQPEACAGLSSSSPTSAARAQASSALRWNVAASPRRRSSARQPRRGWQFRHGFHRTRAGSSSSLKGAADRPRRSASTENISTPSRCTSPARPLTSAPPTSAAQQLGLTSIAVRVPSTLSQDRHHRRSLHPARRRHS